MTDDVVKQEQKQLNLVVKNQWNEEVHFKVKLNTKFEKVFAAYSQKKGVDANLLKFLHDGKRVQGYHTPAELDIEDGDCVDVMIEQLGGSHGCCQ